MQKIKTRLLSAPAKKRCIEIAQLEEGVASQRAKALLAIDEGMSQSGAAKESKMSLGQVKYAIDLFRKKKLALFPADLGKKKLPSAPGAVRGKTITIQQEEESSVAKTKEEGKKVKKDKEKGKDEKKLKKVKKAEGTKKKDKKDKKAEVKEKGSAKVEKKAEKKAKKKDEKQSAKKKEKKKEKSKKSKK